MAPASRASRALQIVLTEPSAWDRLSTSDHVLLCDLTAPHGPLFTWLAGQAMEFGPQPWGALREALRGHPDEAFAVGLIDGLPPDIESDEGELTRIVAQQQDEQYAAERHRLAQAAAAGDQAAYEKLKAMPIRRPG